jgi:hypothetical protein
VTAADRIDRAVLQSTTQSSRDGSYVGMLARAKAIFCSWRGRFGRARALRDEVTTTARRDSGQTFEARRREAYDEVDE